VCERDKEKEGRRKKERNMQRDRERERGKPIYDSFLLLSNLHINISILRMSLTANKMSFKCIHEELN